VINNSIKDYCPSEYFCLYYLVVVYSHCYYDIYKIVENLINLLVKYIVIAQTIYWSIEIDFQAMTQFMIFLPMVSDRDYNIVSTNCIY
jgi:hypothetical protein